MSPRSAGETATVAVAISESGRHHFVSTDGHGFARIGHFPASLAEAKRMAATGSKARLTREQLMAEYPSQVVLIPLRSGH